MRISLIEPGALRYPWRCEDRDGEIIYYLRSDREEKDLNTQGCIYVPILQKLPPPPFRGGVSFWEGRIGKSGGRKKIRR